MEGHSFGLEGQLRDAQTKLKEAVQKLQQQQQGPTPPGPPQPSGGWVPEPEVERRVAEAVAEAVANAERDGEEAMNDLLVCLGQVGVDPV